MGRPDAIRSRVHFEPERMTVTLLGFRGIPVSVPITSVTAMHALDSDGLASIGSTQEHQGRFRIALSMTASAGTDRFVVVDDASVR